MIMGIDGEHMLTIQAISAFKDNYIWFIQPEGSQKVLIVDPGDARPVIQTLVEQKLVPVALLITHGSLFLNRIQIDYVYFVVRLCWEEESINNLNEESRQ